MGVGDVAAIPRPSPAVEEPGRPPPRGREPRRDALAPFAKLSGRPLERDWARYSRLSETPRIW